MGRTRVIVVGAGAFGGWSALALRRRGLDVALIDAWGPGHARSSSGGETRILRLSYPTPAPLALARRARELWVEEEARSGRRLFYPIGLLWMAPELGDVERAVVANLDEAGVPYDLFDRPTLAARYPQIRTDDLEAAIFEPGAGYLLARAACRAVLETFVTEGGDYVQGWAEPGDVRSDTMQGVRLSDGTARAADAVVFAGGPWLVGQFRDRLGLDLPVTRQEVFVFGTPPGDDRFGPGRLPVWAWRGDRFWYGIPGEGGVGGFKVADDTRGPAFDPTAGDRSPSRRGLDEAWAFLADRFPALAGAPTIAASVCQYTEAPGGRFLADRLPGAANAWVVGGGSGHGFKHGPAVGEYVADLVVGGRAPGDHGAFQTIAEAKYALVGPTDAG